jgi:hypothetical protein
VESEENNEQSSNSASVVEHRFEEIVKYDIIILDLNLIDNEHHSATMLEKCMPAIKLLIKIKYFNEARQKKIIVIPYSDYFSLPENDIELKKLKNELNIQKIDKEYFLRKTEDNELDSFELVKRLFRAAETIFG